LIVIDGLARIYRDMSILHSRRGLLRGAALAPAFWLTKGAFAQQLVSTPALTIGPYYPNQLPLDLDNDLLLINDSITPSVGEIMWVQGKVLDSGGNPVRGAVVEIWQADNNGAYIHTGSPLTNREPNFQGYGKFETASDGRYIFRTVKPGIYPGRTRHIHYQIRTPGRGNLITQVHFEGEALNANDMVLNGIQNAAQRASVVRPIESVTGSAIGEKRVTFDIVMGITPEDAPAGTLPVVSTRSGVVNAASSDAGATPGAWITIHGFRLASTTRTWNAGDIANGQLPTSLDGVSVTINGKKAFVYHISPKQINVQAPADTLSGAVQVVVTNAAGTSASTTVQLQSVLPGFFRLSEDYVTATDAVGGFVGPENLVSGLLTMPAKPGDTIVLWGTGFGPTNPALAEGEVVANASPLLNPVKIRIGQATAQVNYAGVTAVGVYQFNVVVPDLPTGDYPVRAEVAGVRTSSVPRLRIKR
jgi:protocatechuate 3,4-dioxygenase beta subunit